MTDRAVFLDRDGILNVDRGYTFRISDLSVPAGVPEALARLHAGGFRLVVVTNQSGVARGKFTMEDVSAFHAALQAEISRQGGPVLDSWMVCPHHPEGTVAPFNVACDCRKPETRLVKDACHSFQLDPQKCFFIGDKWSDVLCGIRAGTQVMLVQEAGSLTYSLPANVAISYSRAEGSDEIVGEAQSRETGRVMIYSSLSSAVSSLLSLKSLLS
jgi:D-glycero-D-manno-heptose 1,7-bisphosphate phosphatase